MTTHRDTIVAQLRESCRVKQSFSNEILGRIEKLAVRAAKALRTGHKLVLFGNGGSAADAQHLAAELVVRLTRARIALPALALTTNTSILTAAGNDYGFERIFARQVEAHVRPGDVLVALSTSGSSPNVLRGVEAGARRRAFTVAMTGETGGKLARKVDLLINVPSRDSQRIQEAHITIGHIVCSLIEEICFGPRRGTGRSRRNSGAARSR
ncbi:MAG: D-sedoheptulose 7-phosphate isomerase [Candidatus Acidiferrales bacterium]|jgi:D-sedoheptulose 7-phosphate isomerase